MKFEFYWKDSGEDQDEQRGQRADYVAHWQSEAPQVQRAQEEEEYHPPGPLTVLPPLQRPLQDPGQAQGVLREFGCTYQDDLSKEEQAKHAYFLALAAILRMYNFGELLAHKVLDSL